MLLLRQVQSTRPDAVSLMVNACFVKLSSCIRCTQTSTMFRLCVMWRSVRELQRKTCDRTSHFDLKPMMNEKSDKKLNVELKSNLINVLVATVLYVSVLR